MSNNSKSGEYKFTKYSKVYADYLDSVEPGNSYANQSGFILNDFSMLDDLSAKNVGLIEISDARKKSLRELYDLLDMDNDGKLDYDDLTQALTSKIFHVPSKFAPALWDRITDGNNDQNIVDFNEFSMYIVQHENKLEEVFNELDKNNDGMIDVHEIKGFCNSSGIDINDKSVNSIINLMSKSGKDSISKKDFINFMTLYPCSEPKDIINLFKHNLIIDIGEDGIIPEDFSEIEIKTGVWWRHLVAGGIAGCFSRTATAPLDRLKVFMQVHATMQNKINLRTALTLLYNEGGFLGLWRGNGINVTKIAPESATKFMVYEQMKKFIQKLKGHDELTIYERLIAGSTAGAVSQTLIYPMEVLKTRLALRRTGQLENGLVNFSIQMYKTEGLRAFYKGYIPNLLGIIPYAERFPENKEPGVFALLACGTCSSICGQLASYPLALVRTRLQARKLTDLEHPQTMVGQFRHILKNEGITGLYRGLTPNFIKVIPAVGISYITYEKVRKYLGANRENIGSYDIKDSETCFNFKANYLNENKKYFIK
ncbi:EF-hand domain and Mitochondrial carrier protein family and EF-hand domain pair and Mitochondrial substrate/solute carrier repeat and Mitochondrial carrier domain-containing protein [Strongyloides ratti]|uniref:EF-hand domain and Mitochondrial carrier protein family and EF-hand domain pair and Mitochondrial substrate/solute carrier repeat and Mitochondrial carrier domain-containing protein n=1 Tax=Strongyloides ratti TaxID=34506 RepID=A0A090LNS7_STRRB|nr:EF-hand domain and Mitochondrial carrier protein family and EF-hand domain pair and Mitochondrial substrate/solute carrier repeat and Mitochondrial carrier domain-containing protein [Strongyloides ratti]CEF69829.1 EF-hand domain and Mitochondrial carrier protein family and EF-hand domain pair and Mitochondrial substrate/solute carrier repeat and Mitochondrial carrier domain-containing protein [Strongyloides ratti]